MASVLFRPLGVAASRRALKQHRKLEVKELKKLVKFAEKCVGGRGGTCLPRRACTALWPLPGTWVVTAPPSVLVCCKCGHLAAGRGIAPCWVADEDGLAGLALEAGQRAVACAWPSCVRALALA